ncbi:M15 family metallopeptidase [Nocardioides sp. DS6]|uniref:M15 family metallopeptidase n=1 Tax=Nocardioides eburneus TaxID=3231482 RepID=A0ABV3T3H0_9ACTN
MLRLGRMLATLSAAVSMVLGIVAAAAEPGAAASAAPRLTLAATQAYAGSDSTLTATLAGADGQPLPGATVTFARRSDGTWRTIGTATTDAAGRATDTVTLAKDPADNRVRATYTDETGQKAAETAITAPLRKRVGVVRLGGPAKVVDERSARLTVTWRTWAGEPVAGVVHIERRYRGGVWRPVRTVRTYAKGTAAFTVRPRVDTWWRARASATWVAADVSPVHKLDNVPPGKPVWLPKKAPRPRRHLPAQPHAVGAGAHPVITRIPNGIWRQMVGVSWHSGCPVGRAGLRLLRINYWDYAGYRRRGELVAAAGAIRQMSAALAEMYRKGYPIRAMYRVDRFGYSKRSHGGNDYASMAADNTYAFNCRDVTGRPGVRSPHSYGRALDVNTWENPYRSAQGLVPDRWWQFHSHPRVAWRSSKHPVVRIMARHGLRWTYGLGDTQHFDAVVRGRPLVVPGCGSAACD